MKILTVGSGSKGNCYVVESNSGQQLLIECGVPFKEVIKALDYDISNIQACITTHAHIDHYGQHKQYEKYAIPIWQAWKFENTINVFGDFVVVSFDVPHDGTENRGFMIRADDERIVYVTDCEMCRYVFKTYKPSVLMTECNHEDSLMDTEAVKYSHSIRGHMALSTCKDFITANATDALKAVILIHASEDSLDWEKAVKEVQSIVPDTVSVVMAVKGTAVEI